MHTYNYTLESAILNSCLLLVLANLDNFRLFTKEVYSFLIELLKVKPMSVLATLRLILSLFWSGQGGAFSYLGLIVVTMGHLL